MTDLKQHHSFILLIRVCIILIVIEVLLMLALCTSSEYSDVYELLNTSSQPIEILANCGSTTHA